MENPTVQDIFHSFYLKYLDRYTPVSYTHLDVYKRQGGGRHKGGMNFTQAFVRNVGTHGLMLREYIKRKNHKIRVPLQPWGQIRL